MKHTNCKALKNTSMSIYQFKTNKIKKFSTSRT